MASSLLQALIDKQDTVEIVRDQLALILANESLNQQALALAAAKDPLLWKYDTGTDLSNPFEKWLNEQDDRTPIINVWFDTGTYSKSSGNVVEKQKMTAQFNIDCYGLGIAQNIDGGGHILGDEKSAKEAHRIMRLARNILMSSTNTYLQLRGVVWGRFPASQSLMQPRFDNNQGLQVTAGRIILSVDFWEFSPQYNGEELELLNLEIKRDDDGFILAEADYTYPQ